MTKFLEFLLFLSLVSVGAGVCTLFLDVPPFYTTGFASLGSFLGFGTFILSSLTIQRNNKNCEKKIEQALERFVENNLKNVEQK